MEEIISIIVPVYNVESYLAQCLDSLINQTYKNIEIICVNDGSSDGSSAILEKYAKTDFRIKTINQSNRGLSEARNTGIKYAIGKYIMFVDSDDWIELSTCQYAWNATKNGQIDLIFWGYVREFQNQSKEKRFFWKDAQFFDRNAVHSQLHRRVCGLLGEELAHPEYANAIETAWGKLYKTEKIKNIRFVDTKKIGTEDALFNLYALGNIESAVYLDQCFNHYRKTNTLSLTSTYKEKLFPQWQYLFDLMEGYINEQQLPQEYETAFYNRIALSILGLGLNIVSSNYTVLKKVRMIRRILSDERYREAYRQLEYKYFPIHWKLFYKCAKWRFAGILYSLLIIINRIIKS